MTRVTRRSLFTAVTFMLAISGLAPLQASAAPLPPDGRDVLAWFLAHSAHSGPCPNCDPRQTIFGTTVLPSPLTSSRAPRETRAAPVRSPLDLPGPLTWRTLREWLSQQKQEKKAAVNVAGKWTMTLEMSMGTATPALDLKQDGQKITGTYTGRYGTFNLEGTLKERTIEFSFNMTAEGETVAMAFAGEVAEDGQTMKGTAVLGEQLGEATWSAKRQPAK